MKVTTVPAQITTVEDRIAGNLGLNQLLLLATPIFIGSVLYTALPPVLHSASYKLFIMVTILSVCSLLAVRIKGKILLLWLVIIVRYNRRPGYYIFNKNSLAVREQYQSSGGVALAVDTPLTKIAHVPPPALSPADSARVLALMDNPAANLYFETTKKGGLSVIFTEVKDQA